MNSGCQPEPGTHPLNTVMLSKIINFCKEREKEIVLAAIIVLVAMISFGLGRLSKIRERKAPITIENAGLNERHPAEGAGDKTAEKESRGKTLVASKKGSKYHYPWCSGARRIKKTNEIWFATAEEARGAGYSPASNCKGLK